jgi:hypothetical protein
MGTVTVVLNRERPLKDSEKACLTWNFRIGLREIRQEISSFVQNGDVEIGVQECGRKTEIRSGGYQPS